MKILGISGSASAESSNTLLLRAIQSLFSDHDIEVYEELRNLPLFRPEDLEKKLPPEIIALKNKITTADALIISTPEYTHNIPAVLKNALEWLTASGELNEKKVLPITFTPHEPRGKWAMESLLFSLQTMNAKIATQLSLYKTDVNIENEILTLNQEALLMLSEGFKLLKN